MKLQFRQNLQLNKKKFDEQLEKTLGQKRMKWDRRNASMFGLFSFCMLLGVVLYNTVKINCCYANCYTLRNNSRQIYRSGVSKSKCTLKQDCRVDCRDINEDESSVAEHIQAALYDGKSQNCARLTYLKITNSKFNQSQLTYGWLANIEPKILDLTIDSCTLREIKSRAFAGHPFDDSLSQLIFENTNIAVLRRESFLGLNSITSFALRFNQGYPRLIINKKALDGIKSTLQILQFNYCSFEPTDIENLVGGEGAYLTRLLTLDLRMNRLNQLYKNSFISVPFLQALYLQHISLERIYVGAFNAMRNVHTLDLNGNALETLPEDAFSGFTRLKAGGIMLANNNWQCNCSLQWLKEFYYETVYINKDIPLLCSNGKLFEEVNFCPDGTATLPTISTSTTTALDSEATTDHVSEVRYIKMSCQNQSLSPSVIPKREQFDVIHTVKVKIRDESVTLQLQELNGNPFEVLVSTREDLTNYHLLWFNTNNKNENGCITPVLNNKAIKGLNRGTAYTFSLLHHNETEVSPKSTFCVKTEPEWKLRAWILNKHQIPVIIVTTTIFILLLGFTTLITFFCIRKYPEAISSNKSVIIVKPNKCDGENNVSTKEYDQPTYWEPYLVSSSQGYLTPKYTRYDKVRHRPPLMRSISESSIKNSNNQCNCCNPKHLNQMKAFRAPLRQTQENTRIESFEDYRPPLPPPNPESKRQVREDPEELYNAT